MGRLPCIQALQHLNTMNAKHTEPLDAGHLGEDAPRFLDGELCKQVTHVESAPPWQFDVRAFMRNLA